MGESAAESALDPHVRSIVTLRNCLGEVTMCSKTAFEVTIRNHCSKSHSETLSSFPLHSVQHCSVHGYARVHTSIYIYIYIWPYDDNDNGVNVNISLSRRTARQFVQQSN